jgi:hypothetical protein
MGRVECIQDTVHRMQYAGGGSKLNPVRRSTCRCRLQRATAKTVECVINDIYSTNLQRTVHRRQYDDYSILSDIITVR